MRTILHLDMDAFYAAIEQRDHPEWRGRPLIVGADPKGGRGRGVVSTASYEARRFGVGSAMPVSEAWRRCPQGIYVPVDMARYIAVSRQVMDVLGRYSDLVEPLSIDEAFLDVTGCERLFGDGHRIAEAAKAAIREQTGLASSVGVASCKLVAKIASDLRKPDGLVVVAPGTEQEFLAPLPVRKLWGVGPKVEAELARAGITTIGALAAAGPERLGRRLGTHGLDLARLARGEDDRPVVAQGREAKSIGHEHTFDSDVSDPGQLRQTLLGLCDAVARRLRRQGVKGRTVTLKYRDETFRTQTRAETFAAATDSAEVLFQAVQALLAGVHRWRRVRLLGVSVSGFGGRAQLGLFAVEPTPGEKLRDLVDERFGKGALTRASLLRGRKPEGGGGT